MNRRRRLMEYLRGSYGRAYVVENGNRLEIFVPKGAEERTSLWCYDRLPSGVVYKVETLVWWMKVRLIFGGVLYRRGRRA